MTFEIEFQRAKLANQEHIFAFYNTLSDEQKEQLVLQAKSIDYTMLHELFLETQNIKEKDFSQMEPPTMVNCFEDNNTTQEVKQLGKEAILKGELALFTVAGGQGSRLGYEGPKGCYPITPIKQKSLFESIADKIKAANVKYSTTFDWYIMTSYANDAQTKEYFQSKNYFDMKDHIVFFSQDMLPAVDTSGKLLLVNKHQIFTSPNGTGGIYDALFKHNITKRMQEKGIKYISYFQIDNPLTNFLDEGFLGHHIKANTEFSTKVVAKAGWDEKVGVLAKQKDKTVVVEYSQMSESQAKQTLPDGSLAFNAGNIAFHIINRSFVDEVAKVGTKTFTPAFKKVPHINKNEEKVNPQEPNAYKFESFVFDALAYAHNSVIFEVKREEEFAPTKNATGVDSVETAIQMQIDLAKSWMTSAGFSQSYIDSLKKVEINPLFALTREDFVQKTINKIAEYESNNVDELYFS